MGDAGERLIDVDARIQERMDELEEERRKGRQGAVLHGDPERTRQLESCRLARTELKRQLDTTTHQARRQQLNQAIQELDKRIKGLST